MLQDHRERCPPSLDTLGRHVRVEVSTIWRPLPLTEDNGRTVSPCSTTVCTEQLVGCLMDIQVYVICYFCYMLFNAHLCIHIIPLWTGGGTEDTVLHVVRGPVWGGWELGCWRLTRKRSVRQGSGAPSTDGPGSWLHTTYIHHTYIPIHTKLWGLNFVSHCPTPLLGRLVWKEWTTLI